MSSPVGIDSQGLNESSCGICPGGICSLYNQTIRIIYGDYEGHFVTCDLSRGPSPSSVPMDYGEMGRIGTQIGWQRTRQHLEEILRKFNCVSYNVCFTLSMLESLVILDHNNT